MSVRAYYAPFRTRKNNLFFYSVVIFFEKVNKRTKKLLWDYLIN